MPPKTTSPALPSKLLQTLNGDSVKNSLSCKLMVLDVDKDDIHFNNSRRSKA